MRPSGTVTFLFTDVEGSTRLWEQDREAMGLALERHDELLRDAIESHRGYVFTTAGDSFAAAFALVSDAVTAAVAAQRALQSEPWGDNALRVRIGLHSGAAAERDGDYFGPVVNRAARLMGIAHGGQILVSATAAGLLDRQVADMELRDLGEHVLKDLAEPTRVWQIAGAGLMSEFPPLRSVDSYEHNLPVRLERLIGRDGDARELADLVRANSLVTVLGPGGVGKTRLAVQVAAEFLDECVDGVWLVDLTAASSDIDSVASAVGRTMGFDARQGESWHATVVAALSVRDVLLVLDNCEHALEAVATLVRDVLDGSPAARVLLTSRERLDLRGERVWRLSGLEAGPELFAERAAAIDPGFDPNACADAISTICARLDGLPLAIELAAARVGSLQPAEIATRLDQRFRLLRSRDRTTDQRHRTLEATVDWSYQQLGPDAAELFERLGVIIGTFDLDAAAGLMGDDLDEFDVADILDDLVAKSLLATSKLGQGTRYRLLETMAAFAVERLAAHDELEGTLRRHARSRAQLTSQHLRTLFDGTGGSAALSTLMADLDDIDAVFDWAIENDVSLAESIFLPMVEFQVTRTLGTSRMLRLATEIVELYGLGKCSSRAAARAASVMTATGAPERADAIINSLLADESMDVETRAEALNTAAWCAYMLHEDAVGAVDLIEESVPLVASTHQTSPENWLWSYVVINFAQAGALDRAVELLYQAPSTPPANGYLALARYSAEGFALRASDLARSTEALQAGMELCLRLGDLHAGVHWFRYQLALNTLAARDNAAAARELASVLPGLLDLGDPLVVGLAIEDFASALARTGNTEGAASMFAVAEAELSKLSVTAFHAYTGRRERLIPRLRDHLGSDAFDAAWSQGHKLTIDEAVRFASSLVDS